MPLAEARIPEFMVTCELSGKRLLRDETDVSAVTGKLIDKSLLKTSAMSGTKAETEYFGKCQFSGDDVLKAELAVSEISNKAFRKDQQYRSAVSGKTGHKDEFITCAQTGQPLTFSESEQCEVTFKRVSPGILETCAVTGKRVIPAELERCAITGKRVLKSLLVTSSISGLRMLEEVATRSTSGSFCSMAETGLCAWSDRRLHPADLCTWVLTALLVSYAYARPVKGGHALQPLLELLEGLNHSKDRTELWPTLSQKTSALIGKGRCHVESAVLSPSGKLLAASVIVRTMFGLKTRKVGVVYSLQESSIVGRVVT